MSAQSTKIRSNIATPSGNRRMLTNRGHAIGQYSDDVVSVVQQTARGLNAIRKLINIEFKYTDTLNTSFSSSQVGSIAYVSGITQGLDVVNRVGDSIRLQHVYFNYTLQCGVVNANCRVMLVRDMENKGVDPVGSDLLSNAGTTGVVVSHLNYINGKRRFHVLYDEVHSLNVVQEVAAVGTYSKSHNGHILFRGTTSGSASAAEGSIYLAVFTDAAGTPPVANVNIRLLYTDD